MKLTGRLAAAAALIPEGRSFADIGTDHGYIPVYMCHTGKTPRAVAVDIGVGPLQAARTHIVGAGLQEKITCRLGNGLTCLTPGEVEGGVICGMGGRLMTEILRASPHVWRRFSFLVLQPMWYSGTVRRFLYEAGWHIEAETLVTEEHRLYEVMRAVPGRKAMLPFWLWDIGPVNWRQQDALLARRLTLVIARKKKILNGLLQSRKDQAERIRVLQKELAQLEARKCRLL
ncbi:class I SAM-dependent methyltransferase [uncultured Megasphaera sp.]|uniref:tRNA (adenine(22)-N(1))-methyltransferase n=1 Tax=uncultured Megasphaera sp. TaxID=165188 RepID=UPI00288B5E3B|nr:class I SAM-dependent methyltransferase [uncultured Megasphaera sp.]